MPTDNRAFRLRRRPEGELAPGDLELVEEEIPDLQEGQALVRNLLLSVDPTNRIWMSDIRGYMPAVELGGVMRGLGIGEVVESRREDLPVGTLVTGFVGWQEHCLADDSLLDAPLATLPEPLPAPIEAFLGPLGHTGITAYLGIEIGDPKEGETVAVSAACGAVGSIAGQLAKQRGARVVGLARGEGKCRHAVETLGFDACVDCTAPDWRERFDAAAPEGVDVDFENAGGAIMDHVLTRLKVGARIALCGMVSDYNRYGGDRSPPGQHHIGQLIMQRATMTGFLVLDHADRFGEAIGHLATLLGEGRLHYDETIVHGGLEAAPDAYARLFSGEKLGKVVLRLAGD